MSDRLTDEQRRTIEDALASGGKIAAIREYRSYTGSDLKTAKEAVEAIMDQIGLQDPGRQAHPTGPTQITAAGCVKLLIALAAIAALLWYLRPGAH